MTVAGLEVRARGPFAGGAAFGDAGPYERLDGVLHFAVDPADPANAGIVDLAAAERDPSGRVQFSADLCLLQPVAPARGNRRLLLEVPNRGRKGALGRFNRPAPPGARPRRTGGIGVGDGLMLNLGWTVAWCGWQWDVIRTLAPEGLLGFDAPQALDVDGRPIQGQVMLQWQPNEPTPDKLLADRVHQPYPAARLDDPDAVLQRREWLGGPATTIPRERWQFARDAGGRPEPDDTHVWLAGGFEPGVLYELIYTTRICPVVGTGLLAIRDSVSFLRYGTAGGTSGAAAGAWQGNPCAGRIEHTFGFGSSQTGRFLRTYLSLGLNVDEAGRQVFDGLMINVAGARRGEFNHRYAQPSVITIPSFAHLPPFTFDPQSAAPAAATANGAAAPAEGQVTGAAPADGAGGMGLLDRQRARGGVPRIVATNSSSEYWTREASLLHTDPAGTRDVEPLPEVRVYHFAGTKHGPGSIQPEEGDTTAAAAPAAQRTNVVDFTPLLRAAFFNLVEWVTEGKTPPPSAFPRLADGTAADRREVLRRFSEFPGVTVLNPEWLQARRRLELGPEAARGVGRYPPREGQPYPSYAPAVDVDGNETGGIRLPDVALPVASHTGWFSRRPGTGGAGQNTDMVGATIPFAPTAGARWRTGDPRPAVAERYASRDDYHGKARVIAEALAAAGYLLPEDVDTVVQNALARYDAFAT